MSTRRNASNAKPSILPIVLLTGFEPFGGETSNPSWDAVQGLHGARIAGHRIHAVQLPVAFGDSLRELRAAMRIIRPALVICVGQGGGRTQISIERIGINVDDARAADNRGQQPVDEPIIEGGPAAYFSTLPIKAMLNALHQAGIPAEISQTAGTYVCNHVLYGLMHTLSKQPRVRGGFIHIPYSPAQATRRSGASSMPIEIVQAALRVCVRTALSTQGDLSLAAGAES